MNSYMAKKAKAVVKKVTKKVIKASTVCASCEGTGLKDASTLCPTCGGTGIN